MKSDKVLVLGTSFSAMPIIKTLQKHGYSVSTVGGYPNEVGHKISDKQYLVNYADTKSVENIIKEENYKNVIPTSNDTSYRTVAALARAYELRNCDSPELAEIFLEKEKFKKHCLEVEVSVPRQYTNSEAKKAVLKRPLIVKANDQSSGIGMSVVFNQSELSSAIKLAEQHSLNGEYLIEDFISGQLISFTVFQNNGEIYYFTSCREYCGVSNFQVSSSEWPSFIDDKLTDKILVQINKFLRHIECTEGMSHFQLIVNNNEPYFLEAMRRCPGDLFPRGVELSENFKFYDHYIKRFLEIATDPNTKTHVPVYRQIFYPADAIVNQGIVSSFPMDEYYGLNGIGDEVRPAPYGKIGISFSILDDPKLINLEKSNHWKKSYF